MYYPCGGRPQKNGRGLPGPASGVLTQATGAHAQLMAYARDLARAYAAQKLMAQYLPADLCRRITQGDHHVTSERRYVTVLFADLAGFTRLASRLEAEELFSLMNACFQRLASCIYRYGGVIDKFIGDGLMALFGAPRAHEDDPERAVRAALDMQVEMRAFSRDMQPRLGVPLQLHIGINSGEVVAGSIGVDGQLSYTVMGETVNLASRLHELAGPGSIFVGESVCRQTMHIFEYEYLGEYYVQGIERPVPVYSVGSGQGPRVRPPLAGDIPMPWVGRDQEMAQLAEALRRLVDGQGGVVAISGEAGLGKTRLVREWLAGLPAEGATVWWGTAHMFQQRIACSLWRDLLQQALHLRPARTSPDGVAMRRALLAEVGHLAPSILALVHKQATEPASHLGPETALSQTRQAIHRLLAAQSRHTPLILVVDNWQWVDDLSRDLLLAALPMARQHPVLFCLLHRSGPGSTPDFACDIESRVGHRFQHIRLPPLAPGSSWELLSRLIITEALSEKGCSAILARAQGNPLYLKELLQLMAAEGIIEPACSTPSLSQGGRWRVVRPERLASLRTPPTLSGLAQANLDRLPRELQEVLTYAAVIGPTFSFNLLQAVVARERDVNVLPAQLQELVAHNILEPAAADGRAFAFRHTIVQETIYNGILAPRRQALHRLVADELEVLPESDTDASVELIAHHFLEAGAPARAVPYLIHAGRRAQQRSAYRVAIEHYRAALGALDSAPRYEGERLGLEMALGEAYRQVDEHERAIAHYRRALELCAPDEKRADICRRLGATCAAMGDWLQAWMWLEQALECLAEGGVPATSIIRGQTYAECARVEAHLGHCQRAELWAREAIVILEGSPAQEDLANCYETLCDVYSDLRRGHLAARYAAQAIATRKGVEASELARNSPEWSEGQGEACQLSKVRRR